MRKRHAIFGILTGLVLTVCVFAEEEEAALPDQGTVIERATAEIEAGRLDSAREWIIQIQQPAARFYLQARMEQAAGNVQQALRHAATVVVFHHRDPQWAERAEWLCARLYREAGMTDAAAAVARQIQRLYAGREVAEQARQLLQEMEHEQTRDADEATEGRT